MKKVVFNIAVDEKILSDFKDVERTKAFREGRSTNFNGLIENMMKKYIGENKRSAR